MSEGEPLVNGGPETDGPKSSRTPKPDLCPEAVDEFRRKLKYFFMSPCEKYHARGRKPWKLMLQIVKIAIITVQLVSFGLSNEMTVTFKEQNLLFFKHLFLKGYGDQEGSTIYKTTDVYDHINYVIKRFISLQNLTAGNHAYKTINGNPIPLSLCQEFYRHGSIFPSNDTFDIDPVVEKDCISIHPMKPFKEDTLRKGMNFTLDFQRLLSVKMYLNLKAINLQTVRHYELPDCYDFSIRIVFDNRAHSGLIKISLESDVEISVCKDLNISGSTETTYHFHMLLLLDSVVILACVVSLLLCTRSVSRGIQLQFEYRTFVYRRHGKTVPWSERLEFINGWYILIIISDILTISGSVLKICIQTKELTNYDVCSIMLGTGTMLVWIGVLRYLGFFQKYNILILTLRAAFPNVIRFSFCAIMIYLSYCFCGWIVLGPHHENFRNFDLVAYCLFSMINGDEIYSTFTKLREKSYLLWFFSRIYVYSFISLFTYIILSLFIALITDTYETIKKHQQDGVPLSELQAFMSECRDLPGSGKYLTDKETSTCSCFPCLCLA
ncbi:mucolipin-3 [Chanos chanos]|uniref:Mucolipin-3 n=1 Tax=Chanos chanos TaxID=29144 RepID=A0A6J2VCT1_CHACN|nr:mucolipin-3-like [Chanos chanos]